MSWLVNTLANSLKLDDDDDGGDTYTAVNTTTSTTNNNNNSPNNADNDHLTTATSDSSSPSDQTTPRRGVKDDLSEISKTFTRQLWGVASFLAPPPQISSSDVVPDDEDPAKIGGIRNDLSEIGGKFRSEISKLSSNKAVSEFTKMASNLLHFGDGEDLSVQDYADRGIIGITEEVVSFARDVAMHPETWLDFPLPHDDDDDEDEDFELSDAQQDHALAVERLAPELAALRTELCLSYMTEGSFWKIYFVLVHPRLSRHDAAILSTPPIFRARAMLTQELQRPGKSRTFDSRGGNISVDSAELAREEQLSVPVLDQSESVPVEILSVEPTPLVKHAVEMDKHPIASTEDPVIEKAVIQEEPKKQTVSEKSIPTTSKSEVSVEEKDEDDADEWLKEETSDAGSYKGNSYPLGTDDDVSFSDFEDDDDVPTSYKKTGQSSSTTKVSSQNPEKKESNDWLDIEDINDA